MVRQPVECSVVQTVAEGLTPSVRSILLRMMDKKNSVCCIVARKMNVFMFVHDGELSV